MKIRKFIIVDNIKRKSDKDPTHLMRTELGKTMGGVFFHDDDNGKYFDCYLNIPKKGSAGYYVETEIEEEVEEPPKNIRKVIRKIN